MAGCGAATQAIYLATIPRKYCFPMKWKGFAYD